MYILFMTMWNLHNVHELNVKVHFIRNLLPVIPLKNQWKSNSSGQFTKNYIFSRDIPFWCLKSNRNFQRKMSSKMSYWISQWFHMELLPFYFMWNCAFQLNFRIKFHMKFLASIKISYEMTGMKFHMELASMYVVVSVQTILMSIR